MSKSVVFPYGITLQENNKVSLFPAAEVGFFNKNGELLTLVLLIDSGATISALPKSDAATLGVIVENDTPIFISGIGKEVVRGWEREIKVQFGEETKTMPFLFLDNDSAPRLLGRKELFERNIVIFEEKKRRSAVVGDTTKEARAISRILNNLS